MRLQHLAIIFFFMVGIVVISCDDLADRKATAEYAKVDSFGVNNRRDVVMGVMGTVMENNIIVMEYHSPLVYQYFMDDTPHIEFVGGVEARLFDETSGDSTGNLTANYGIFQRVQERMYFRDQVKVLNKKGDILRADDLWWDKKTKRIHTENRISFLQSGAKIYGIGLDGKQDMSDYEIKQLSGKIEGGNF